MKKISYFSFIAILLCGCINLKEKSKDFKPNDYGAYLGRYDNNDSGFKNYKYISIEMDEFPDSKIKKFYDSGIYTFAYLNAGSIEEYRDYFETFEDLAIADYDNYPDEKWIDISDSNWQNYLINTLASDFKNRGAFGIYLDNIDVYTTAKELKLDYNSYAIGIKNIISGINNLGLKIMMNGGSEFIDDMNDQNDPILNSLWAYHQEEVFSLIEDYENNIFGKQEKEDSEYYKQIASIMKAKGKSVFFLEYTKDNNLISNINDYCTNKEYHYYIANSAELD